ncbi:MAG: hypothetical protein AVDCRST_MAG64-1471, partial [uncultured Phycisphaerae bacterium]
ELHQPTHLQAERPRDIDPTIEPAAAGRAVGDRDVRVGGKEGRAERRRLRRQRDAVGEDRAGAPAGGRQAAGADPGGRRRAVQLGRDRRGVRDGRAGGGQPARRHGRFAGPEDERGARPAGLPGSPGRRGRGVPSAHPAAADPGRAAAHRRDRPPHDGDRAGV